MCVVVSEGGNGLEQGSGGCSLFFFLSSNEKTQLDRTRKRKQQKASNHPVSQSIGIVTRFLTPSHNNERRLSAAGGPSP